MYIDLSHIEGLFQTSGDAQPVRQEGDHGLFGMLFRQYADLIDSGQVMAGDKQITSDLLNMLTGNPDGIGDSQLTHLTQNEGQLLRVLQNGTQSLKLFQDDAQSLQILQKIGEDLIRQLSQTKEGQELLHKWNRGKVDLVLPLKTGNERVEEQVPTRSSPGTAFAFLILKSPVNPDGKSADEYLLQQPKLVTRDEIHTFSHGNTTGDPDDFNRDITGRQATLPNGQPGSKGSSADSFRLMEGGHGSRIIGVVSREGHPGDVRITFKSVDLSGKRHEIADTTPKKISWISGEDTSGNLRDHSPGPKNEGSGEQSKSRTEIDRIIAKKRSSGSKSGYKYHSGDEDGKITRSRVISGKAHTRFQTESTVRAERVPENADAGRSSETTNGKTAGRAESRSGEIRFKTTRHHNVSHKEFQTHVKTHVSLTAKGEDTPVISRLQALAQRLEDVTSAGRARQGGHSIQNFNAGQAVSARHTNRVNLNGERSPLQHLRMSGVSTAEGKVQAGANTNYSLMADGTSDESQNGKGIFSRLKHTLENAGSDSKQASHYGNAPSSGKQRSVHRSSGMQFMAQSPGERTGSHEKFEQPLFFSGKGKRGYTASEKSGMSPNGDRVNYSTTSGIVESSNYRPEFNTVQQVKNQMTYGAAEEKISGKSLGDLMQNFSDGKSSGGLFSGRGTMGGVSQTQQSSRPTGMVSQVINRIQEIAQQVKQSRVNVRPQQISARFLLQPKHLGSVLLKLQFHEDTLRGTILTQSKDTKQTLERQMPAIREALSHQNLVAQDLRVEVRPEMSADSRQSFEQQLAEEFSGGRQQQTEPESGSPVDPSLADAAESESAEQDRELHLHGTVEYYA